ADRHAVLALDEGDVIEDEEPGLADAGDLLDGPLRRLHAVAAAVEGPRAAERAVPGTAPAELDGRARVELADEVLPPVAEQLARRQEVVEMADERRRRPLPVERDRAGHAPDRAPVVRDGVEQRRDGWLPLAAQAAIDRTTGVAQDLLGGERDAGAADEHERAGQRGARLLREIDDLGYVGEVVPRERDDVRRPVVEQLEVVGVRLDLEVDHADGMPGLARGSRHELETHRLQAQEDLRVHETARMNREEPHCLLLLTAWSVAPALTSGDRPLPSDPEAVPPQAGH